MNAPARPLLTAAAAEALEARLAARLAAGLSESAQHVDADIGERLRVGREQALERARQMRAAQAARIGTGRSAGQTASGTVVFGGGGWWGKLGAALPLVALVIGLLLIERLQLDAQISAAAEIDVSLLADDVPPLAYSDPGFVEFLKTPGN